MKKYLIACMTLILAKLSGPVARVTLYEEFTGKHARPSSTKPWLNTLLLSAG